MRLARRRLSLFALSLLSLGCDSPTAPDVMPAGAVAARPQSVYTAWWSMVESCSGRHGELDRVSWYTVPTEDGGGFSLEGGRYDGYWYRSGHRILLADGHALDGPAVRHEMLHDLLDRGDHPRMAFVESCAGVVRCEEGCDVLGESGRGVSAGAHEVTPDALELSIVATPTAPSAGANDGWFTVTVLARNPSSDPVWVRLPDAQSFLYVPLEDGFTGQYRLTTDSRWAFRAGETRREVFDLHGYPPGTYTFVGFFGRQESLPITVSVGP